MLERKGTQLLQDTGRLSFPHALTLFTYAMASLAASASYDETKKDAGDFAPDSLSTPPQPVHNEELEKMRRKERLSSTFTVICAGFALISDGLQNNSASLNRPDLLSGSSPAC